MFSLSEDAMVNWYETRGFVSDEAQVPELVNQIEEEIDHFSADEADALSRNTTKSRCCH